MAARGLLLGLVVGAGLLPDLSLPPALERLLASPRSRTAEGIEAFAAGDYATADERLAQALASDPEDPLRQLNAGTAALAAADADRAGPLLEQAAHALTADPEHPAPPDLLADTLYNLGNTRFAKGDAAGAVEAYKQALRTLPEHGDAKHNLELALRQLERERQAKEAEEAAGGSSQGEQETSDEKQGSEDPGQQQEQEPQAQPDAGQGEQQGAEQPQPGQQQRLPSFEPQPDMSAEQAAAILEAVENLEREARRAEAAARAAERPAGERDW